MKCDCSEKMHSMCWKCVPRQNGWNFAENISKFNFLYDDVGISIEITMKFVAEGQNSSINSSAPNRRQAIA